MKKAISVVLAMIIAFSTFIHSFAIYSEQNSSEISADKFASEVASMIDASETSMSLPLSETESGSEFETGRLVVKSKNKIDTFGADSVVNGYNDLWVLQYSSAQKAAEAYEYYSSLSGIDFVEPDKKITAIMAETEPDSGSEPESGGSSDTPAFEKTYLSWGTQYIGLDVLNEKLITEKAELSDVVVAVVDTGVDPDHPHLKGRVLPTRINTSSSGTRNSSMDDSGHGTQVAGVIIDSTLDNVYVKPYKVLDNNGSGTLITLAAGINCAVNDGVSVINISAGFEEKSEILESALLNAESNDILIIASAGNDGSDTIYYPASYENVLKISAVNNLGSFANFSTYGNGVDFAAPGVKITTTTLNNQYRTVNGTSLSAPFVSALAATFLACEPNLSDKDIIDILKAYAVKTTENEYDEKYGYGIINAPQSPIDSGNKQRTAKPYFSHEIAFSFSDIDVEIFCDTPDSVIYYTTDNSVPSNTNPNAIKYDGTPIHISKTTRIMAVAYCEGMYRSPIEFFATIIAPYAKESELEVNASGVLTAYNGPLESVSIPATCNGITITEIGEGVFADSDMCEVLLPYSVTKIGNRAFENCTKLKTVYSRNATVIGDYAFNNCTWMKNLFLISELESIGKYAFANTGYSQYAATGSTITLNLKKLTQIPEGAFSGSALSRADLGSLSSIGKDAFTNCNQLVNVHVEYVYALPSKCFMDCASLSNVEIHGLNTIPEMAFRDCHNLVSAKFPDAANVNARAFLKCVSLTEISLPKAAVIHSNAFYQCSALKTLTLPSMESFEASLYKPNNTTSPLLPENLEMFDAQKLKNTVPDMFINCTDIVYIRLNGVSEIAPYTFSGCHNIYSLNIESIETIGKDALSDCSIVFIDARSLITTDDLPDNSGILLSNNFLESTDKAEELTVYGTADTFVERYANLKGYKFVEIPLIYKPVPEYITENSETVYVIASGFDLTYQWYWNTVASTENANPIEGATALSYTFTDKDTAPYYFCKITQNDLGKISEITTSIIQKDTTPADYTEYNKAVEAAKAIDRNLYKSFAELDDALSVDVSNRYSCEQSFVDEQTLAINRAIANLKIKTVDSINLYCSDSSLNLFDDSVVIAVISPNDVSYESIEWISSNEKAIAVFPNGYVICVGYGISEITVRITNHDGSVVEGSTVIEGRVTPLENTIGFIIRGILVSLSHFISFFVSLFRINLIK